MAVPVRYKRNWLRDQIVACMNQYTADVDTLYGVTNSELKIETEIGDWRWNWFKNRDLRIKIMGHPILYCEVVFTGPSEMTKQTVDGRWLGGMHEFAVSFFFEYKAGSSTDLFEDMTDEISPTRKGLLVYLRELGIQNIPLDDNTPAGMGAVMVAIRQDGDEELYRDQRSVVTLDPRNPSAGDKAHLLTFRANVTDVV